MPGQQAGHLTSLLCPPQSAFLSAQSTVRDGPATTRKSFDGTVPSGKISADMSRNPASGGAKPKYVIGSGWWSSALAADAVNPKRKILGDDQIRAPAFFDTWLNTILENSTPYEIAVVDSHAEQKPDPNQMARVKWIELPFNARHATEHVGRWCGWTRSVLVSGQYALAADAEYFVYIEQDCLIGGKGVIEHCIAQMKKGIMFGDGRGTPQPIQQSFFIVHRKALPGFLRNLVALTHVDAELSPEWKFVFATSRPWVLASNLGLLQKRKIKGLARRVAARAHFDVLPIGSGRVRPIPMNQPFFYFQHGTAEELERFREHRNL